MNGHDINWDSLTPAIKNNNLIRAGIFVAQRLGAKELHVVGGSVYRTLASAAYKISATHCDVDIVVDRLNYPLRVPRGWDLTCTSYPYDDARSWDEVNWACDSPRLTRGGISVDLIELHKLGSLRYRSTEQPEATIVDYLKCVGLTVQSICYDVSRDKLWGEAGVDALRERLVLPHNQQSLEMQARQRSLSVSSYITNIADSLGFEYPQQYKTPMPAPETADNPAEKLPVLD